MVVDSSPHAPICGASRETIIRRLMGGALPVAALFAAGQLIAADAINTASLGLPSGTVDTNLANNTVTDSDTIIASLTATDDTASNVNGLTGGTAIVNVLTGDTVGGNAATPDNAVLSVAPGSSLPDGLIFDPATGNVDVAAGTPAGTYTFDYSICERDNPDNCETAGVTIEVVPAVISAGNDTPPAVMAGTGGNALVNVLDNDTLGGTGVDPDDITLSVVTPAVPVGGGAVPVLDPATGLVSVPQGVPAGTYTITYEICEKLNPTNCSTGSVTVVVEAARSNLAGTVYLDVNGNRVVDDGDIRKAGWIVEVVLDGEVVATAVTDANGDYLIEDLLSGPGYEVRFRNPANNVVYGVIDEVELGSGETVVDQNLPLDPSGVIYNSITREPIAGVMVSLVDRNGTLLPDECLIDPSQQNQLSDAEGDYRFDIVTGAASQCPNGETQYRIVVTPPSGFGFVSSVILPQGQALNPTGQTSPFRVSSSAFAPTEAEPVYYLSFLLGSGDPHVVNNHIPLDPFLSRLPLVVTKTSTRRSASTGDLVPYEITVRNAEDIARSDVDVIDVLPPGMKYVTGSAAIDGVTSEPETANGNRELVWHDQVIPANGSVRYTLTLVVGAGVTTGERINTGVAERGSDGSEISNRGTASVSIIPSAVFDCSELLGKVFEDTNRNGYQDEGEPGVPGARLATVNGQLVTTDEFGRYHIACAAVPDSRIGSNYVLKLDLRTVPLGWEATTDNPRSIRLTRGKFGELNFGVAPPLEENAPNTRKGGE